MKGVKLFSDTNETNLLKKYAWNIFRSDCKEDTFIKGTVLAIPVGKVARVSLDWGSTFPLTRKVLFHSDVHPHFLLSHKYFPQYCLNFPKFIHGHFSLYFWQIMVWWADGYCWIRERSEEGKIRFEWRETNVNIKVALKISSSRSTFLTLRC